MSKFNLSFKIKIFKFWFIFRVNDKNGYSPYLTLFELDIRRFFNIEFYKKWNENNDHENYFETRYLPQIFYRFQLYKRVLTNDYDE